MKKKFKHYHQFSDDEFKKLWKKCIFVFDTSALLNMYRYSRKTVESYFKVLKELKTKEQLWIPYQVGFEFYENRINVISEYECSYDSVLQILEKAKKDIEVSYKNHPFLDLNEIKREMESGLASVESRIKKAKDAHPKWMEKDDVLDEINLIFEDSVGPDYNAEKLDTLKKEGKERYDKKIPPGFKDDGKPEDKKYGDLIVWYQIIDKAKETKKPIILITGDVKEDWWLEKSGKRIMPRPALKKEIFEKAGVDFHIYTADRFLEYHDTKMIDKSAITEIRKIRELEEERNMMQRSKMIESDFEGISPRILEKYSFEVIRLFEELDLLLFEMKSLEKNGEFKEKFNYISGKIIQLRNRLVHGHFDVELFHRISHEIKKMLYFLKEILFSENSTPELLNRFMQISDRLEYLMQKMKL